MANVCDAFVDVLNELVCTTKQVTLTIKSGENCCEVTGCLARIVDDCYVVIINNNNEDCPKTFVRIDCICAIQVPGENNG